MRARLVFHPDFTLGFAGSALAAVSAAKTALTRCGELAVTPVLKIDKALVFLDSLTLGWLEGNGGRP